MEQNRRPNLGEFELVRGGAPTRGTRVCLMQAVAYWAGMPIHTDRPPGVSPLLNQFGIMLNDSLPHEQRQRLVPFIPRLADSQASPEVERARHGILLGRMTDGRPREGRGSASATTLTASAVPPTWDAWASEVLDQMPEAIHGSLAHTMSVGLLHEVVRAGGNPAFADELIGRFERAIALGETVPWALDL